MERLVVCFLVLVVIANAQQVKLGDLTINGLTLMGDSRGQKAHAYIGIPFAKPPVGELRWVDPQPLGPQSGVLDATRRQPACPQDASALKDAMYIFDMFLQTGKEYYGDREEYSEDCLYLDIYTPSEPSSSPRDVMVWIHGGGFNMGASHGYDGRVLATTQDVIVVVIQYRLGIFGFLSTEDENAHGNYGLKDQSEALRWVKKNIGAFGGDPNSITIFGESAGGVSVGMHTLSPLSEGLFHRGILHSGTELMQVIYSNSALVSTQYVASKVDCLSEDNAEMVACLRTKSSESLLEVLANYFQELVKKVQDEGTSYFESVTVSFGPRFDGVFFPEYPMVTNNVNDVELIVGFNDDEFCHLMAKILGIDEDLSHSSYLEKMSAMAGMMAQSNEGYTEKLLSALLEPYPAHDDAYKNKRNLQKMYADSMFKIPALSKAAKHSMLGKKTWMYEFTSGPEMYHDHSLIDGEKLDHSLFPLKRRDVGADHGDDLVYSWGLPFHSKLEDLGYSFTESERELSDLVMGLWGNFAHGLHSDDSWPTYSTESPHILRLSHHRPSEITRNVKQDPTVEFWTATLPQMMQKMAEAGASNEAADTPKEEL